MSLAYDDYLEAGGTLSADDYADRAVEAEALAKSWTAEKWGRADLMSDCEALGDMPALRQTWRDLVDSIETIREADAARAQGQEVSTFSNGQVSMTFAGAGTDGTAARQAVKERFFTTVPLSLTGTCVAYEVVDPGLMEVDG